MSIVFDLREQYGDVFVSETPDGIIIPWKPLSIGDYFEYENRFGANQLPPSILEDEIFKKCVTDQVLVTNIDRLKAGTVTTVVATIMKYSGPMNTLEINEGLNLGRARADQIIHHLVTTICWAFPAYKPDDLYQLDFSTFMLRLAQAEDKLLRSGIINQPLNIQKESDSQQQQQEQIKESPKKKAKVDLNKLKQEFEKQGWPAPVERQQKATPPKPSSQPAGFTDIKPMVITKQDTDEHAAVGGTGTDAILDQDKMIKDTAPIYKDYLDTQNKTGKLSIPSHEERVAAAKARAEINKKTWDKYIGKFEAQEANAIKEAERIKKERQERKDNKKLKRKKR